jgi:hypothetical protein
LYLVDNEGHTAGLFAWTLVREWVAFSLLSESSPIFLEGDTDWRTVADFPELRQFPKDLASQEGVSGRFLAADRLRLPSLACQHLYSKALGCPFDPIPIDRHLLSHIIWSLSCQFPDRVDPAIAADVQDASDWHNDPATDRQIAYLQSSGATMESRLTKGRACQLIGGEPTDGQLRRLAFYGIRVPRYLTKEEASDLIDGYITQHPESEEQYQAWKIGGTKV